MRIKFLIILLTGIIIITCYSFNIKRYITPSYKELSKEMQLIEKNNLINKLTRDSVFLLYSEISNIQVECQLMAYDSKRKILEKIKVPSSKKITDLTNYYKDFGVERPEQYAKMDILKSLLLIQLGKKYAILKNMDLESIKEVLSISKKSLKSENTLIRKDIIKKVFKNQYNLKNN